MGQSDGKESFHNRDYRSRRIVSCRAFTLKGYEVHGLVRRSSIFNTSRIDQIYVDPHDSHARMFLHYGDLSDSKQILNIMYNFKPDEVYPLGAQSHVRVSFETPEYTGNVTGLGTTCILEAV